MRRRKLENMVLGDVASVMATLQANAQAVFCAALTGVLANPDTRLDNPKDVVGTAYSITAAWIEITAEAQIEKD